MSTRIMDSIKRFFTLEEESFASHDLDSDSLEPAERDTMQKNKPYSPRQTTNLPAPPSLTRQRNLVSVPAVSTGKKQQIVVLEPASFADAREIAESLREKKCILLNMRKTDKELARRIVDFLSGISYAMEGSSQKVAEQIFLFVPGHMEIVIAEQQDGQAAKPEELMSSGAGH